MVDQVNGVAMNLDSSSDEINFDPFLAPLAAATVESSIVQTIVEGSGGPDNSEITDAGLRFVRHLLATSKMMRFGFMPNLKNMDAIRAVARDFIRRCGGSTLAFQTMQAVTDCD